MDRGPDAMIDNLIGGHLVNTGKVYFEVQSEFCDDARASVADASELDVAIALSKAKQSWDDCQELGFPERVRIVTRAADSLSFTDEEIDSVVRAVGMPKRYVASLIAQIPDLIRSLCEAIPERYGVINGKIGATFAERQDFHKIEFRIPRRGFAYAVTPGNDPRVTAVVSTILALLGIPGIIKPSKTDHVIPFKVIRGLIDAGYPENGLAVVFLNSDNPQSSERNFKICDQAAIIWPFGDDKTVDRLLRNETREVFDLQKFLGDNGIASIEGGLSELRTLGDSSDSYLLTQTIDHFASKVVLRHASGRCAGILDQDLDLELAAKLVIDSSMRYPIGCNSMKCVFVAEPVFEEFARILQREFGALDEHVSDPLKLDTEVGYVSAKVVAFLERRIAELARLGLISVLHGGRKISRIQMTPLLASTNDMHSELLVDEIPGYVLCLAKVKSFEEGVSRINGISEGRRKLAVSYFTNDLQNMRLYVNAYHVKVNSATTDLDGLVHEGNDYVMQLTTPYMVHLQKTHMTGHPYRSAAAGEVRCVEGREMAFVSAGAKLTRPAG